MSTFKTHVPCHTSSQCLDRVKTRSIRNWCTKGELKMFGVGYYVLLCLIKYRLLDLYDFFSLSFSCEHLTFNS